MSGIGLPAELTGFVGRRNEVADIRNALSMARLVTLTGPGGVGKSRLALRVASHIRKAYAGGAAFVDLAPLTDDSLVAYSVAEALGIEVAQSREDPVKAVTGFLAHRQVLLVLDDCDRLVAPCAGLAHALLRAADQVRILATSRRLLGVSGEHVYDVEALPVPGPETEGRLTAEAAAAGYPGLELFAERGRAVGGFRLTDENWPTVAQLCRRLDGLPLAIELAAVRTRVLSPRQILERLDDWTGLLVNVDRNAPHHHRTLRAAMDWSHDMCSPAERLLWARASVFSGRFGLEAVEGVCGGDGLPAGQVLEAVTGLVDKSVLVREEHAGHVRFRMLETVARYGRDRLTGLNERDTVAWRHRDWFMGLAEQMEAAWYGPDQMRWSNRMRAAQDDLRAALRFCLDTPGEGQAGLAMAASLHFYWFSCGHLTEGRMWLERFLDCEQAPTPARARALRVLGLLAGMQADREAAVSALGECQALAGQLGDPFLSAAADAARALAALNRGLLREAVALAEQALACPQYARHPDHFQAAAVAGCALALADERDRAATMVAELRRLAERTGAESIRCRALLGAVMAGRADAADDERRARKALAIARDLNDAPMISLALLLVAWAAISAEEHERGAVILGICHRTWNLVGVQEAAAAFMNDRFETRARLALGDAAYLDATARGERFDMGSGISYALAAESSPERSATGRGTGPNARKRASGPLTAREQQVAKLVALGLSNREIAARLLISPRTVDGHVQRILAKLGISSRSRIATWVAQQDDA
ncbi:ATP-binding protein [Streptomyces sp. MMS24-I31]|uniref:ATP-binding protein n=1 Tax=Streptomyces sp. MMS24-I31 TaxID=3351563 RepID=UPI003896D27D